MGIVLALTAVFMVAFGIATSSIILSLGGSLCALLAVMDALGYL